MPHITKTSSGHLARCGDDGDYHLKLAPPCGCFGKGLPIHISASWNLNLSNNSCVSSPQNGSLSGWTTTNSGDAWVCTWGFSEYPNPHPRGIALSRYASSGRYEAMLVVDWFYNNNWFTSQIFSEMSGINFVCAGTNVFTVSPNKYFASCDYDTVRITSGTISITVTEWET